MSDDLISRKALLEEIQSFRCSITGLRAGKGVLARAAECNGKKEEKSHETDDRWKEHIRSRFEHVN